MLIQQEKFLYYLQKQMQEIEATEEKQMQQESPNRSTPINSQKLQPFLINRQNYSELCLYQKNGHWSDKEKLKYILFIEHFKERFLVKAKRRFNNIFDSMALFIKTRNSHQCRSHHQKMQKEKFQINRIIESAKEKYDPQYYNLKRQYYLEQIQGLEMDSNEDFNEFKQKIQRQQQKKAIQRQKIAQNKRILRSTKRRTSNHVKKANKHHHMKKQAVPSQETHPKEIFNQENMDASKQNDSRIQQAQNQVSIPSSQLQENQEPTIQYQQVQPIFALPNQLISPRVYFQPHNLSFNDFKMITELENQHKYHSDLAYFHYSECVTHSSQANNIQQQLMSIYQSIIEGNFSS